MKILPPGFLAISFVLPLAAQLTELRGTVTDESGGVVPGAVVAVNGPRGLSRTAASGADGGYSIADLAAGNYTVRVSAPGLALSRPARVQLKSGVETLNLQLKVAALTQQITIEASSGSTVSSDPANNAGAIVLKGSDLQALADDPNDLAADLQALAGPSAGPNGGAVYIDGFSGGQLPSKDSIREIRINQNPFAPEYDKLGFGRIEILTKPGADKFHGTAFYNFADDIWNSRNPYAAQKAPFLLREYGGNVSGPLNKRSSFFLDLRRDATDNGSIINGITLDPETLGVVNPYTQVFRVPQRKINVNPRVDYQLGKRHTLVLRYGYVHSDIPGAGVGGFNLDSRAFDALNSTHTVQATETAVVNATTINEIRFQYFRAGSEEKARNSGPAIQVLGSFNGGGAPAGHSIDTQKSYEFQDYVTVAHGAHTIRFGLRLRGQTDDSVSQQNFGGTFTFGGGTVQSIEQYRRTRVFLKAGFSPAEIRAMGGGATQFSRNAGAQGLSARQIDAGGFAGDDWRARPNLTLSLGLRYEAQTNIGDRRDIAPRVGLAWAPGGRNGNAKWVLRAGFGMFYDRFALANTLAALRYNGVVQQQYVVADPDFYPNVPPVSELAALQSTQIVQRISPGLRAPHIMQSAAGVDRQLPLGMTVAITYANSHGLHVFRSRDINAPLPESGGARPQPALGPVFQMESAGIYNQHQLIVNLNAKINQNVSLVAGYMLNRALSNTDGLGTFPANQYNMAGEYGPASTDLRNRMTLGGTLNSRWNVRLSPFVVVESGPPFDITVGRDLYGTTLFNGRPGIAADPLRPGLVRTQYGLLDPNPSTDEKILPRNYGRGPGSILVNLRIAKTIGFGRAREGGPKPAPSAPAAGGGGGARRGVGGPFSSTGSLQSLFSAAPTPRPYNLIVSMSARNVINHNNPGAIVGNITSPLFGRANQPAGSRDLGGGGFSEAANNRRLELQARFTF